MLAHFQLGKCYLALGDLQEALKELLKAAELEPSAKSIHYQLSQVYARLNDIEKKKYHLEIFEKLEKQEREKNLNQAERLLQREKLR
jgi:tetratricopeptide (TPR) repeat protein